MLTYQISKHEILILKLLLATYFMSNIKPLQSSVAKFMMHKIFYLTSHIIYGRSE